MPDETKVCANCKQNFIIEPEDFAFYQKIDVPPPTWCPDCRYVRRLSWFNEWRPFRKKEAKEGKEIFSTFSPESYVKIYENNYWYGDNWDPLSYGREYDFDKPFFTQIRELLGEVPLPPRSIVGLVNSDYSINSSYLKNCYLVADAGYTEDSAYIVDDVGSEFSFDLYASEGCELCYQGVNMIKCYKTFFSVDCELCHNVLFSRNCVSCENCFGCANLRHKSYYIFNQPHSKEEYSEKIKAFDFSSQQKLAKILDETQAFCLKQPVKFIHGKQNENVTGDYIYNSKNSKNCYRVKAVYDSKFCQNLQTPEEVGGPTRDSYDYTQWGEGSELIYDSMVCGRQTRNLKFCYESWNSNQNLSYCLFCQNTSDLFGCVGLHFKKYCILNKQYSKEEYEKLTGRIIQQMKELPYMDKRGIEYRYGEFFPPELSPHEYNITVAQEYTPFTKEQALQRGFHWKDPDPLASKITVAAKDLPENIKDVKDDILKETIGCLHEGKCNEQCTLAFRLIPQELEFYRKMGLPLPRLCPNCRHYQRIKHRNPFKLYHRKCRRPGCTNKFETTYAPDRPEIVYCEDCYVREVR